MSEVRDVLRVLVLEDDPADAELEARELRPLAALVTWERVDTEEAFRAGLAAAPDVVLSDFAVPGFDGLRALEVVKESGADTPFVLVSGVISVERAVAAMKLGAYDFVMKYELSRLRETVGRAIELHDLKRAQAASIEALRGSEERFRLLTESATDVVFRTKMPDGRIDYISPSVESVLGYAPEEFYADPGLLLRVVHPDDRDMVRGDTSGPLREHVARAVRKDGKIVWMEYRSRPIEDAAGTVVAVRWTARDVSERVAAAAALEERTRASTLQADAAWAIATSGDVPQMIERAAHVVADHLGGIAKIDIPDSGEAASAVAAPKEHGHKLALTTKRYPLVLDAAQPGSLTVTVPSALTPAVDEVLAAIATQLASAVERWRSDRTAREAESWLQEVSEAIGEILWAVEVDERRPDTPVVMTYVSPAVERLLGVPPSAIVGPHWLEGLIGQGYVAAEDVAPVMAGLLRLVRGEQEALDEDLRLKGGGGEVRWIRLRAIGVSGAEGGVRSVRGIAEDITEQKRAANQLSAAFEGGLAAAERERSSLAAELHDGPVQRMTAVLYGLERALSRFAHDDVASGTELLGDVRQKISNEIAALRRMMTELRPPVLDERGLSAAIRDYAKTFGSETGIACEADVSFDAPLDPGSETTLYRVLQEALANVRKHAQASKVAVKAWTEAFAVRLEISDDGRGFDVAKASAQQGSEHFGIVGMTERLRIAGGVLTVGSAPGGGTTVEALLPLRQEAAA